MTRDRVAEVVCQAEGREPDVRQANRSGSTAGFGMLRSKVTSSRAAGAETPGVCVHQAVLPGAMYAFATGVRDRPAIRRRSLDLRRRLGVYLASHWRGGLAYVF